MIKGYWFFYLIKTVTFQLKRGHYFFQNLPIPAYGCMLAYACKGSPLVTACAKSKK